MKRIRTRCFLKKARGVLCLALTLAFLLSTVSAVWATKGDDQLPDGFTASLDSSITEESAEDTETAATETPDSDDSVTGEKESAEAAEAPTGSDTVAEPEAAETPTGSDTVAEPEAAETPTGSDTVAEPEAAETPTGSDTVAETEVTDGDPFSITRVETEGNTRSIKINTTTYATLQAAVNAASSGETINVDANYNMSNETANYVTISGKTVTISTPTGTAAATLTAVPGTRHIEISSGGTLILSNIILNGGDGNGGGVYVNGGTLVMNSGAVIEYCLAETGGGVYVDNEGSLTMGGNAAIQYCNAEYKSASNISGRGGGVYVDNGTLTMGGSAEIRFCVADTVGGGVCFVGAGGKMEMNNNSAVKNNETYLPSGLSASYGGGIYLGRNTELTMNNQAQVRGNKVAGAASGTAYYGGGIYIATETCKATMKDNTVVSGNTAYNAGGVFTQGEFTMSDYACIEDCNAVGGTSGGGIACGFQGSVLLEGSVIIQRNSAPINGGGVAIVGGVLSMRGGTIQNNVSANGSGVHISRDTESHIGGRFYMSGGLIDDNTASANGGGVFVTGVSTEEGIFKMTGGTVSNNTAGSRGGGVYLSTYSFLTLNEDDSTSKITANEVTAGEGDGGGVYVRQNSNFTMSAGTIDKNMAPRNGGGVYLYAATAEFQMSGGMIGGSGNKNMAGEHGGGAYINAGTFIVNDGTISNNTANKDGGGIYTMVNGIVNIAKATISGNTATGDGGGIYTAAADYVTSGGTYANLTVATSVIFSGNTADKAYIPLDETKTPYDSYWTTIQNSNFSSGVTVPVVSRLASVNNYDINASLVLVKFDTNGGGYYVNGSVDTIPDQSHVWNVLVTDPESVANSEMYLKDYEFEGWTLTGSSTIWDFSSDRTTSTADVADGSSDGIINLVAKWKEIEGSITINKYKDDGTTPLPDAEFTLTDSSGAVIGTPQVTNSLGIVEFKNLPVGDYVITETKAPHGYSLLGGSFDAKIPTDVTGSTTYMGATKQTTPDGTKTYGYDLTYEVTNQASFTLPEAGAAGIWNQYSLWIGLVLLLTGGGYAAWWMKRK